MTGTLREDQCTFMITSRLILHGMQIVLDKIIQKVKTHILCSMTFFFNRAVYEIIGKNNVEPDKPHGACAWHSVYLRLKTHAQNM